jgi:hypothetical protein
MDTAKTAAPGICISEREKNSDALPRTYALPTTELLEVSCFMIASIRVFVAYVEHSSIPQQVEGLVRHGAAQRHFSPKDLCTF